MDKLINFLNDREVSADVTQKLLDEHVCSNVGYCSFSKAVSPVREQTDGNLNLAVRQPKPNP